MHYSKAVKYFTLVDSSVEILRAQLERVALAEFQLNGMVFVFVLMYNIIVCRVSKEYM